MRRDLAPMLPLFSEFSNFKISHFYVFKKLSIKYIDRYIYKRSVCKKVSFKNILYFERYKKDKFLIVKSIKIVVR
jgi:hypothetical protein